MALLSGKRSSAPPPPAGRYASPQSSTTRAGRSAPPFPVRRCTCPLPGGTHALKTPAERAAPPSRAVTCPQRKNRAVFDANVRLSAGCRCGEGLDLVSYATKRALLLRNSRLLLAETDDVAGLLMPSCVSPCELAKNRTIFFSGGCGDRLLWRVWGQIFWRAGIAASLGREWGELLFSG